MGRAAGVSCFRVIICGKDVNQEVHSRQASEGKGSSFRKWSFRKRSATQTFMMSTVVISEPVLVNNECPDIVTPGFQGSSNMTLPEQQISLIQETEVKTEPLSQPNLTEPDTIVSIINDTASDTIFEEYSVVFIQAAIRGFLARRLLLKRTSIIKLQAAIRGHLVRMQAIGTLRCIQSIIKVQAYVRARRTLAVIEESINFDQEFQRARGENNPWRTSWQISIDKLQGNPFVCKLMASAKINDHINIKCEALKPDCAWDWFQRWMSVAYVIKEDTQASGSSIETRQIAPSDSAVLNISAAELNTEMNPPEIGRVEVVESANTQIKDIDLVVNSSLDKEDIGIDSAKTLLTMESNPLSIATGSRFDGHSSYYGSETEASEAEKDHGTITRARKSESSRYTRSVPSYMKATESARYRTSVASGSPKFSSDVLDMSRYIGRRSSTDGNERYPCVLRSLHRSQQFEEGTATHSPRVVSQRRWMR